MAGAVNVPAVGSSPLTRGAPATYSATMVITWLIPAHAGSTNVSYVRSACVGAHPRSRGEHRVL